MFDTSLLRRLSGHRLLLKALSKKEILVPAYTRADGTYVPAHYKHVNYNPNAQAVLSGKSSHSHKEALKKLSKVPGFKDLPAEHQHAHILSSAQNIQTAASKAAQVSVFKKELLAGVKPKAANIAAFNELKEADPAKAAKILDDAKAAIGDDKVQELLGATALPAAPEAAVPAGPSPDELAIAHQKLLEIGSKPPGMHYPYLAWKKLSDDLKVWGSFKNSVEKLQAVVDLAKQMQAEATAAAKISTLTKKLAAGKSPSPSEMEAFVALADDAKMKAIKSAVKKSGNKLSLEKINELLDQGAAKAGIEMAEAPPPKAPHFGQQHEGQAVGTPNGQSKFKFEDGKWAVWNGSGWGKVNNAEWEKDLGEGQHPVLKKPLVVVTDPTKGFGEQNAGKVYDGGSYVLKFEDGQWLFKYKDTKDPKWEPVANDQMVAALDQGQKYGIGSGPLEQVDDEAPQPDDGQWQYSASDPGMSGNPTMTATGPDGTLYYIVALDPIDAMGGGLYQVGTFAEGDEEPDFKDFASAERIQQWLQKKGLHPPELASLEKMLNDAEIPGPQEGDTKQGVGGVLTLKDGHWTLDNAATVSFFNQHAIQPASPLANVVVQMLQQAASGKGASVIESTLAKVKETAKTYGYAPAQVNDLIEDLNGVYSKVLAQQLESQTAAEDEGDPIATNFIYDHKLTFVGGGSNKFWQVTVDPMKATATTTWGKIGAANPQSKTYKHANAKAAYEAATAAAAAKQAKGYKTDFVQDGAITIPSAKASYSASVAAAQQSFGALNDGKIYEAVLSTGKKVAFKWSQNSGWLSNNQGVWAKASSHWATALDKGVDINGNKVVPFGADGTVYTPKSAPGLVLFKRDFDGVGWLLSTNQGETWQPVNPDSPLGKNLPQGVDGIGDELQPHIEDAYGNPQATDDGPHEGDIKPGAKGWLILKNGHWVKASLEEAMVKLCPVPDSITSSALKATLAELAKDTKVGGTPIEKRWKKVATTKNGLPNVNLSIPAFGPFGNLGGKWIGYAKKTDIGKAGEWVGVVGSAGHNVAHALNWLEHAEKVQDAFLSSKPLAPESPFAGAAQPAHQPAPAKPVPPGVESINGWAKTGGQGGFNEGGTFKDPDGDEWYCKFPAGGAKVARNELLANKLYDAAGVPVPEVKLVSRDGKIGLASRVVKGAVQDKAALEAGKGDGLLSGFVADAWLANWDVVGNNPASGKGWDNILFLNGKAVRIDPGGALLYGGAGGKKTAFGAEVIELDTMRDPNVNARTAKVFGKISQADLQASAEKVLSIPDSAIEQMVQEHGPGDDTEKAALAKTLLARKAHLESKFPKVAAKVKKGGDDQPLVKSKKKKLDPRALPVKPSDLPEPHDFMNWSGSGKAISDKPYVAQNIADEKAIFDFALKGDLVALKKYRFQPVEKETGAPIGEPKTMAEHPSAHVKSYYDSVVTFLDVIANPPEPLKAFSGKAADTIAQLSTAFKPFKYGHSVASVPPNQRLGFWIALGTVANPAHFQPVAVFKSITSAAKALAYDKWNKLPTMVRKFLSSVQGSGSANQPYRDGKLTDNQGQNCREVLTGLYAHASEHQEGFTIYKWINMPDTMVHQILHQPEGLVFQNPGSMCCSRSAEGTQGFGNHRVIIHYAKGAKAMDTFGSSKFSGEQEITTLPGARFMVLSRKMVAGKGYGGSKQRLELEVLMLPPDQTYVDNLKEAVS
jgi:predicted DNA-binding WGR domain protein